MVNEMLFHGSKKAGLLALNAAASQNTIFGPAIYCSGDRGVAAAQSGANVIYKVRVEGPVEGLLSLIGHYPTHQRERKLRYKPSCDVTS